MSRPQILHIIDNKRSNGDLASEAVVNCPTQIEDNQVENEYMKKVDAVRCYWSKLANNEHELQPQQQQQQQQPQHHQPSPATVNQINFHLGAQHELRAKNSNDSSIRPNPNEDFCSFMPSIEIVELDGEKKATIVSTVSPTDAADTLSNAAREPQFDHIRYKVMKSQQLLRSSNILARNKKEAQFDGLIQYLQDYSFQELLSNNNVVIVEPVRTKIERPMKTNAVQTSQQVAVGRNASSPTSAAATAISALTTEVVSQGNDKTNNNETMTNGSNATTANKQHSAIKRHFFYQPVRVNRELYEEELPNPDTVRNVRKFFEEHILPTPGRGITVRHCDSSPSPINENQPEAIAECPQLSPRARRARKYRYLTIDTSYGHAAVAQAHNQQAARRWDSASLSSGISSGDLSSPCDCNDADGCAAARASSQLNEKDANRTQELKGVHVQDFIRQHNTKNEVRTADEMDSNIKQKSAKWTNSRSRPRSAIVYAENSYYREVYEQNARQASEGSKNRRRRVHQANDADYVHNAAAAAADDDVDDADDNNENDDVDYEDDNDYDDDELSESYYVSNDVLEKIRECGSTVTYYGGRVLQNTTPDPHNHGTGTNGSYNKTANGNALHSQHSNSTLTRVRVREFETCSVCQPNECPHSQQLKDKFQQQPQASATEKKRNNDVKEDSALASNNENNDAYSGVKFKLIKSNSCSSRLELAGADEQQIDKSKTQEEDDETADDADATKKPDDCEVVRDIVKRLEASNNIQNTERKLDGTFVKAAPKKLLIKNVEKLILATSNDSELTINNQLTTMKQQCEDANESNGDDFSQVTVNNHINVSLPAVSLMQSQDTRHAATVEMSTMPTPKSRQEKESRASAEGAKKDNETQLEQTYQSSAMNIRLDAVRQGDGREAKQGHSSNSNSNSSNSSNNSGANVGNNNSNKNNNTVTTKICRNKNVDLAFTMTKQQQQQQQQQPPSPLTMATIKNIRKNNSQPFQPTLQSTQEHKQSTEQVIKNISNNKNNNSNNVEKNLVGDVFTVATAAAASHSVGVIKTLATTKTDINYHLSTNHNNNNHKSDSSHDVTPFATNAQPTKSIKILSEQTSDVDVVTLRSDKPKSIIVPVQIHQHNSNNNNSQKSKDIQLTTKANDDKSSVLSCCSSATTTTTSLDKTFVRHYVANDKRLLERRKYDDIEFEEFEVYDPTKDAERLTASTEDANQRAQPQRREQQREQTQTTQQLGVKDLSSLNDELKFKLESDVKDRQDDKF